MDPQTLLAQKKLVDGHIAQIIALPKENDTLDPHTLSAQKKVGRRISRSNYYYFLRKTILWTPKTLLSKKGSRRRSLPASPDRPGRLFLS